ncbi:MarR family transcriptional regulator [Agrobacterium vitis]|uniref:MarR family transcriptional regulator n=2 Tax=Agrobacterium vitis TaxID=373 RepID=A0A6L6VM73_AGRVI|nr:MarR family transcriptional regulator [Agrobacterium vitis]
MKSKPPPTTSNSAQSRELLDYFGKYGLAMKRWIRSNLPTDGRVTAPRAGLLLGLAAKGQAVGMGELGELLGLSPRSMTVLVDGLSKEGLLRRIPHERDRRVTLVEITPAGKKMADGELGPSQDAAASVFEDLSSEERTELLRLMSKLMDSIKARGIDVGHETTTPSS